MVRLEIPYLKLRVPTVLDRMLLSQFFPILALSLTFSVLILQIVELFQNLNRYLAAGVGWDKILTIQYHYIPRTIGWSLPISLLFSTNFCLGSLYSRNELIAILTGGISFRRFTAPLMILGLLFSLFQLLFEDMVIVPSNRATRLLKAEALNYYEGFSQSNVALIGQRGRVVYNVVFYNFELKELNQVTIYFRDEAGEFVMRVDAEKGDWKEGALTLHQARVIKPEGEFLKESWVPRFTHEDLEPDYRIFEQRMTRLEELRIAEAIPFIEGLEASGLPQAREAQTNFYQRLAFSFTPLLVMVISAAVGGRLKKNILLLSLLASIGISVTFYVIQMMSGLMSRFGFLPPLVGAFAGVVVMGSVGGLLYAKART